MMESDAACIREIVCFLQASGIAVAEEAEA